MNNIGERIKALRKARGISQIELARRLGWQNSRMTNYEKGHRAPSLEVLNQIAAVLECSIEQMVSRDDLFTLVAKPRVYSVPLISWSRAANWPDFKDQGQHSSTEEDETVITYSSKPSRSAFALTVTGDSMTSASGQTFPEGCIIVCDPERAHKPGDYVVAKDPQTQSATFKRLTYDGGRWYLQPLNSTYQMQQIDDPTTAVIAVVIESIISQKL